MAKRKSKVPAGATARTPEQMQAVLLLRRSGAATKHDSRARGQRTRQGAKRAAINSGW